MAVYDLQEQEQIDDLKAWWDQYGKYVSAAVTVFAVVVIAVQGWRWYQRNQAEQAGVLYLALSQAVAAKDLTKAKDPATQIVDRFGRTAYAPRAALLYAKLLYDNNDRAAAKQQLQWAIDHSGEDELKAIARFRLAETLLDEKQYDDALKTLDVKTDEAFAALYADLKGDILSAAGKVAEARSAYEIAAAKIDPKSGYKPFVQVKLDALGSSAGSATAPPAAAPAGATATPSGSTK